MSIRKSYVAGRFYPASAAECSEVIGMLTIEEEKKSKIVTYEDKKIVGGVAPHAGYIYSGYEAVRLFLPLGKSKEKFDTIVIVTPNHTGMGNYLSIDGNDSWESPYGNIEIDKEMAQNIASFGEISISNGGNLYEHSGEVMLPFLKYFIKEDFKIVIINMLMQNYANAEKIADAVEKASRKLGRRIFFLASSDFSHYIDEKSAADKDNRVINEIISNNAIGVENIIENENVSVCGYGPIMAFIEYLKRIKGKAELLRYGNSGEITGDKKRVVAYASVIGYLEDRV